MTSDPTLTENANVIGVVPTNVAQTLVAYNPVETTDEPFAHWILDEQFMPAGDTTLKINKGTSGIAVAVYEQPPWKRKPIPHPLYYLWWTIAPPGPETLPYILRYGGGGLPYPPPPKLQQRWR